MGAEECELSGIHRVRTSVYPGYEYSAELTRSRRALPPGALAKTSGIWKHPPTPPAPSAEASACLYGNSPRNSDEAPSVCRLYPLLFRSIGKENLVKGKQCAGFRARFVISLPAALVFSSGRGVVLFFVAFFLITRSLDDSLVRRSSNKV